MLSYQEYLSTMYTSQNAQFLDNLIKWISKNYPQLVLQMKWNQPMFTINDSFVIGFASAKNHISIACEDHTLELFKEDITFAGYTYGKKLFYIKFTQEIDYGLMQRIVDYNINLKMDSKTFWYNG